MVRWVNLPDQKYFQLVSLCNDFLSFFERIYAMAITLEDLSRSATYTTNVGLYLKDMGYDDLEGIVYPSGIIDGVTYYVYIGIENGSYFLELLNDVYYSKELKPLEERLLSFVNEDQEIISMLKNNQ